MLTKFRRAMLALGFAVLTTISVAAAPGPAMAQHNVNSDSKYSAIVIDAKSGEVLYAKRADSPRYPASITKVMTLYLAFEALSEGRIKLTDTMVMSRHAASQAPTKLGLGAGQYISVEDAIQAIAINSANDVAVAMAEFLGGSESRFASLMTLRAQELGMTQTRYVNASGLPDSRQISSARDIAVLSRSIMRDYPQYYAYLGQKQFAYEGRTFRNHNGLLLRMAGVDGLKTGFTSASGYNLSASATRGDKRLIAIVLGGRSNASRDAQVAQLLETGFEVMRRRDAGESITIAQNLFEPPSYDYARPGEAAAIQVADVAFPGQGDDEGPAPTVVAMRPIANPGEGIVKTTASTAASATATTSAGLRASQKVERKAAGQYAVQVGAFKQRDLAQTQLRDIGRRFAKHFADADSYVGSVGGMFRSQFKGLTADAARAACSALKDKRVPCMVIAP